METYSKQIRKAFETWSELSQFEPENETTNEYKNWKRRNSVAGNKFEALCKSEGLNYCEVYKELLGDITISGITRIS